MDTQNGSSQTLDLIGIFHYVAAAILYLKGALAFLFMGIGAVAVTAVLCEDGPEVVALVPLGLIFFAAPLAFLTIHWVVATAVLIAGRRIGQRSHLTYCQVVAGLACLCVPFGTILGVITLIFLTRDDVKAQFDRTG